MKDDEHAHLTELDKNIIYGVPFKEDKRSIKKQPKVKGKSSLPKPPNRNVSGLPDGFL